MNNLSKAEALKDPSQPTLIYDIQKPWEQVITEEPIWLSGKFPELPKEKKYNFLGHEIISPIAISAGNASGKIWTDFYLKMGYGMVIQKTRRSTPRKSNQAPNISIIKSEKQLTKENLDKPLVGTTETAEWDKYQSITNSFGNPSSDIQTWSAELREQVKSVSDGQILACSVTATFPEGGPSCFKLLHDANPASAIVETALDLIAAGSAAATNGAVVVEFNLACPNVTENSEEGEMFQNEELVKYLFAEFKRRFPAIAIGFKFGLYKDKEQMRKVFKSAGGNLDYVSGINALAVPVEDENGGEILPGRKTSGVCGKILKDIALESVKWADEIRKEEGLKYQILGGGGIIEVSEVDEFLAAGADMVQVATIALADPLFAHKYELSRQNP
jgi:dihydroorotate dehydrogenase (NAD+) catalytic subunit